MLEFKGRAMSATGNFFSVSESARPFTRYGRAADDPHKEVAIVR